MDFATMRRTMVDTQQRPDGITDADMVAALLATPREAFVPKSHLGVAYSELEIQTSPGRSLWTPRDTGHLLSAAAPKASDIALVIGAGAGYEAAVLSHIVETVIALDDNAAAVDAATDTFAKLGLDRAVAVEGDLAAGLADQGPFDVIIICGMVQSIPDAWKAQLAEGGRLSVVEQVDAALGQGKVYTRGGDATSARIAYDACPPRFAQFDVPKAFVF